MEELAQYLHEIGDKPLLDAKEEKRLSKEIEAGNYAQAKLESALRDFPDAVMEAVPLIRTKLKASSNTGAHRQKKYIEASRFDSEPSKSEIIGWYKAIKRGNVSKNRFIEANLRLVVSLAKRYPNHNSLDMLDIIQEGNIGLERAVCRFDWSKGFKFSTYATFWIKQSITRALDKNFSIIRIQGETGAQLRRTIRANSGNVEAMDPESAELYSLTNTASLDSIVGVDGKTELIELLADYSVMPEDKAAELELKSALSEIIAEHVSSEVMEMVACRLGIYDGEMHTYTKIGKKTGLHPKVVKTQVVTALSIIKRNIPESLLEEYPDIVNAIRSEEAQLELFADALPRNSVFSV